MKVNEGEFSQYKIEENHPAIIQPEEWNLVKLKFMRTKELCSDSKMVWRLRNGYINNNLKIKSI